jgi:hypothetical protein
MPLHPECTAELLGCAAAPAVARCPCLQAVQRVCPGRPSHLAGTAILCSSVPILALDLFSALSQMHSAFQVRRQRSKASGGSSPGPDH